MIYKKGSFTVIPNKEHLCGKHAEMQSIYFWICEHADNDGVCFPTRKTIAMESGVNIKTLDKYLVLLVEQGFLSKEVRKIKGKKENTSNLYQILIIEGVAPKTVPPSPKNGATGSPKNGAGTIPSINSNNLNSDNDFISNIPIVIKEMESIDAKNKTYYGNKTQRSACEFLLKEYGFDVVVRVIKEVLPKTNKRPRYEFPHITSPYALMENWTKVKDGITAKKEEAKSLKENVAF